MSERTAPMPALVITLLLAMVVALSTASCLPRPSADQPGGGTGAGGGEAPSFGDLVATPAAAELPGRLVLYFLDVGQADACYVRTPGGRVMLVDAGDESTEVADFLVGKGVERVDALLLTHPHLDHIGGAMAVLDRFEVGTIYDSGFVHASATYEALLERALELEEAGRLTYVNPRAGDRIELDPALTLTVLHPAEPLDDEPNNASVVFRLAFGSFSVLFTGDVEAAGEKAILARRGSGEPFALASTVLKVAHHGSSTSTSADFLAEVRPVAAVISAGADNPYGHPSDEVLDRLAAAGVEVYLTAIDGTVIVHSDGSDFVIVTEAAGP